MFLNTLIVYHNIALFLLYKTHLLLLFQLYNTKPNRRITVQTLHLQFLNIDSSSGENVSFKPDIHWFSFSNVNKYRICFKEENPEEYDTGSELENDYAEASGPR